MTEYIICTTCPLGCSLTVDHNKTDITSITGNRCKRGIAYAQQEILDPKRMVTTTVKIRESVLQLLPVKTSISVSRDIMTTVVREASKMIIQAPVKVGDVLLKNICKTGADIVATRNAEKAEEN